MWLILQKGSKGSLLVDSSKILRRQNLSIELCHSNNVQKFCPEKCGKCGNKTTSPTPGILSDTASNHRPSPTNPSFRWECKQDNKDEFAYKRVEENVITGVTTRGHVAGYLRRKSKREIRGYCARNSDR